jgi:cell division protein FtsA
MVSENETIEVPSVGGRAPMVVPRRHLTEILEPRVEEIFSLVRHELEKAGYYELIGSGAVVTGGTAMLEGMPELAAQVLEVPVRRGAPKGVSGLVDMVAGPSFSTAVGLLQYGARSHGHTPARGGDNAVGKFKKRFVSWLGEIF